MTYLKGLKPVNKIGAAFGSFGWSGESVKHLEAMLKEMKVDIASESVAVKHVPGADELDQCQKLGKTVAAKLLEKVNSQ